MAVLDPNIKWYREHAGSEYSIEIGGETYTVSVECEGS